MEIIELKNIPQNSNPHGIEARKIYDKDYLKAVHITLKPGENLKKHSTDTDVFFYVLEGRGIVETGDEKKEVLKDTFIESPANIPHGWSNVSNEILRILVVKIPNHINKLPIL